MNPSASRLPSPQSDSSRPASSWLAFELSTIAVLWRRDLKRLLRHRSRLVGAVAQPLIFWFVIGSGLTGTFRLPGAAGLGYFEYFYPGVVVMVVLFTGIFSSMSLIEDRREGFLQSVLTAPGSRIAVVLGKVLGGSTVAMLQAGLFLAMAPWAGFPFARSAWALLLAVLVAASVGLTALGFALAWILDSQQGFHAIISVLLVPLWVLSGAMFPAQGASGWLGALMRLNPMTYAVEGTRRALYGGGAPPGAAGLGGSSAALELGVVAAFAVAGLGLAVVLCDRWRR